MPLLMTTESVTWGRIEGYFNLNRFLQGIKMQTLWYPGDKQYYRHHCLSSNIRILDPTFMVDIHFIRLLSTSVFAALSKRLLEHTCITLGRGMEDYMRLQLCIGLGCKN